MKHFLFLYTDAGGGHRAGAEAVKAAIEEKYPGQVKITLVDGYKDIGNSIARRLPGVFPFSIKYGRFVWKVGYSLTNTGVTSNILKNFPLAKGWDVFFKKQKPDAIVSFHHLMSTYALKALRKIDRMDIPVVTAVLDLISLHTAWIAKDTHSYTVATKDAQLFLEARDVPTEIIHRFGMPLHPKFNKLPDKKPSSERLTVMMTGGGDGLGKLDTYLRQLETFPLPLTIKIITGRNKKLKQQLESETFRQQVEIYGFVDNMHEHLLASDLVLAKAGPFAVSEAIACRTPLILYDFIPGLEACNVLYVERNHIGRLVQHPKEVHSALFWIVGQKEAIQQRMRSLAKTDGSYLIADHLMSITK